MSYWQAASSSAPAGGAPNDTQAISSVSIELAEVVEGSDGGITQMQFTVKLDAANYQDITVDYVIQDVSTEGTNDIVTTSGTLTIPAGATEAALPIGIVADTGFEFNEDFTVVLSNPSSNATLGTSQANDKIINDDVLPITWAIVDILY